MLSQAEFNRYTKHLMLPEIGYDGQVKIKSARVLVIGAGGLGCPVLQYLTAAGIGTIGVADFDVVDMTNLQRQILYTDDDIGKHKADIAINKISKQNPNVKLIPFKTLIDESNAQDIISQFDIVIDGSDNFLTRYIVNDACVSLGKPLVYGSILGFEAQVAVFNNIGSKNLRDIFPEPPNPEEVPNCSENGVLGTVTGITGCLLTHEAIKVILNISPMHNQLLVIDLVNFGVTRIDF
ncbi:MAG: HesA/MoeB/ThiF family protein [Bacteroidia bacterium]